MKLINFLTFYLSIFHAPAHATAVTALNDPFFLRYDKAKVIVEGKVTEVVDTNEQISDPLFERFQGAPVKKALLWVEKVWKGDVKAGQAVKFYFYAISPEFGKRIQSLNDTNLNLNLWWGSNAPASLIYLRSHKDELIGATRFGKYELVRPYSSVIKSELLALEAMSRGRPEAEVVDLLTGLEDRQYKIDLEKYGKIKRDGR